MSLRPAVPRGSTWAALFLVAGLAAGCTTYAVRYQSLRGQLAAANYEAALQGLEAINTGSSKLLYHYERGLVLHYQNRFEESNQALDQAEQVLEDLYTRSLSREVIALVTTDNMVEYRGERFEAGVLHYYKVMNYLHLGLLEDAAVECRRLNHRLQLYQDQGGSFYRNDPFLQYLTGMVYAQAGARVDADVSLRAALEAYGSLRQTYGVEIPAALRCDLARNARRLGRSVETSPGEPPCPEPAPGVAVEAAAPNAAAADTLGLHPAPAAVSGVDSVAADPVTANAPPGTLNLFLEVGYVPARVENKLFLPIYKNEIKDDLDRDTFANTLSCRRGQPVNHELKLEYLLEVAMPALAADPCPYEYAQVRPVAPDGKTLAAGYTDVVQNLAPLALQSFQEHEGEILLRAVVRSLSKYLATRETKKKSGKVAGWAMNLFGVATESADTRSWSSLPEKILMSRIDLPAGRYQLDVELFDRAGRSAIALRIPDVEIVAGRAKFLNYRVH